MKTILTVVIFAATAVAQTKTPAVPSTPQQPAAPSTMAAPAGFDDNDFWRLSAIAQSYRKIADETPQAKQAAEAEAEAAAEGAKLRALCPSDTILDLDQRKDSPRFKKLNCMPKPAPAQVPPSAPQPAPEKPTQKK